MEQSQYLQRCFQDQLWQDQTYKQLSEPESKTLCYNAPANIMLVIVASMPDKKGCTPTSKPILNKAKVDYLQQNFAAEPIRQPFTYFQKFILLPKVHKTPWKTRTVVSCIGSFSEIASKW
jgi:hypothetical protein